MVVKVYISGISGNKEVKKRQQRVLLILDSKNIKYELIDIAEPGNDEHKEFMQNNSKSLGGTVSDPEPRHPLPPQLFNDDEYCGDYDQFDLANEVDEMEKFLKLAPDDSAPTVTSSTEVKLGNGVGDVINTDAAEQNDTNNKVESTENGEEKDEKAENGETEESHEAEVKKDDEEDKEDAKESSPAKEEVKNEADSKDEEDKDENDEKADEEES